MNTLAIETKNLTRRFGNILAVNQMSISIAYGDIFGYLGANGAGKSTTIRMLCGILQPTSGTGTVAGYDLIKEPEQIKRSIGYVSQKFSLYSDLTVHENLEFFGRIYELNGSALTRRIETILEMTGLGSRTQQLAGTLSGGWKQKLAVANALLHQPKILFLDEPTAGLDPMARRSLWELLYQLASEKVALFVTTHYMEEAERCNQVAIISQGKLLKMGSPESLKQELHGQLLEVECAPLMKASSVFQTIPGVLGITAYGTTLHVNVTNIQSTQTAIQQAAATNEITIRYISPIAASLEDVFASLGKEIALL